MNDDPLPAPEVEATSMLEEMARGLLLNERMSDYSRQMFELASHALGDRIRLFLQALSIQRMAILPKLVSGMNLYCEYLRDPARMEVLWNEDKKLFFQAGKLLHDITKTEVEALQKGVHGSDADSMSGFDTEKQFNAILGLVAATDAQLPESLQDPKKMRDFRGAAQAFVDVFIHGKELPEPPKRQTRILDVDPSEEESGDD